MSRLILTIVVALALAAAAQANVIINEVDYDQPSTDTAEFIELFNDGVAGHALDGMTVELINGSGAAVYATIPLPSITLGPGEYFVICANPATTPACDLDWTPETNMIQNGAPDAIVIKDDLGIIIDALSYEGSTGAPYGEGNPVVIGDGTSLHIGLSRFPDGSDTDDNETDFSLRCITPGSANTSHASDCLDPIGNEDASWGMLKTLYR
ncbi:lamin tail domain-containing protein [bacterium]|nr:lamin tail domain-containing protein [bacterium]MBU1072509.1 lamin tail domain-containing protein [bacterium]MBU1676542.1 lamin tail domain-containing protein [bacterium]